MRIMAISGINLFEGGPLSVFHDCLTSIVKEKINDKYKIILFVHNKELFSKYQNIKNIEFKELPISRKNYLFRLWYEYVYFYFYSKKNAIDVWFSLHDITPNVCCSKRYVYCHNPTPFMKKDIRNIKYSFKNYAFSLFYKFLYKINIKMNTNVIVQQNWIRKEFQRIYKINNIIVSKPSTEKTNIKIREHNNRENNNRIFKFIYPSFPRFFKNFEVICKACMKLGKEKVYDYEVLLTIDGSENKYSNDIFSRYNNIPNIKFIGLQTREKLFELYSDVDCMIFPSKLETWGLPISEFKNTHKSILLSKLPYAFETLGSYSKACFFDPNNPDELANLMKNEINNMSNCYKVQAEAIEEPYSEDWRSLFERILDI